MSLDIFCIILKTSWIRLKKNPYPTRRRIHHHSHCCKNTNHFQLFVNFGLLILICKRRRWIFMHSLRFRIYARDLYSKGVSVPLIAVKTDLQRAECLQRWSIFSVSHHRVHLFWKFADWHSDWSSISMDFASKIQSQTNGLFTAGQSGNKNNPT